MRRILMTAALPYANGDIHIGHLVEYIQADIWSRYQKMCGNECWFVCADDAHGTPIMLRAKAENILPEQLIYSMQKSHMKDFADFNVDFDNYHSTHSDENRAFAESIFLSLRNNDCIVEREINQLYDEEQSIFLPDRYIKGECPQCGKEDQYGDSCEACGTVYESTALKNPISTISNTTPKLRSSLHYFLKLTGKEAELKQWLSDTVTIDAEGASGSRLQKQIANKLNEWLEKGLHDWDISRDPPYFGFQIPDIKDEKYFYVWLDAPIGYLASFKNLCDKNKTIVFDDFCRCTEDDTLNKTEMYHFIGKDILYFHGLFWPTMLKNSGYRRPTRLFVHGFLTVNGEKMSKSRGTFITAESYIKLGLKPDYLRYYYASKLSDNVEDIDFNLNDFKLKINSDLVGKLINIPSRTANFLNRYFDNTLDNNVDSFGGIDSNTQNRLKRAYEQRRYHEVVQIIMHNVDALNAEIDSHKPWIMAKDDSQHQQLHELCSRALRQFDCIIGYLSPIIPSLAQDVLAFFQHEPYQWTANGIMPLKNAHVIGKFSHLLKRIEDKTINQLTQPLQSLQPKKATEETTKETKSSIDNDITIDDFAKIQMCVATVVDAKIIEDADKLLHLTLDIGQSEPRDVFSGIRKYYDPQTLIGRQVVYLANLKPRKMRFGVSYGMVLAAEADGGVVLLSPDSQTKAGAKIR